MGGISATLRAAHLGRARAAGRAGGPRRHLNQRRVHPDEGPGQGRKIAHLVQRGPEFGLVTSMRVDPEAVMTRVRRVVAEGSAFYERFLTKQDGVRIVREQARFRAGRLVLGEQELDGVPVILATGARPACPTSRAATTRRSSRPTSWCASIGCPSRS